MESRPHDQLKENGDNRPRRRLLSIRTALILALAVAAAGLLFRSHHTMPQIVLSAESLPHDQRKDNGDKRRTRRLLSIRTALILALAILTALAAAGFLYLSHRSVPQIALSAAATFAAAILFYDRVIDNED
jgi:membrane protein YdbS with pleckstrin-like domain